MPRITWDGVGEREAEAGVDRGVMYPRDGVGAYPLGVPWNGLTNVTESPTGAEPTPMYADNIKYLNLLSIEEFEATIEAYTYPPEFEICEGVVEAAVGMNVHQQSRKTFGFCYRTLLVNDVDQYDHGYKLHLVYGALASPSEKSYDSVSDTPEMVDFSWDISTTPVEVANLKPTALVTIDTRTIDPAKLVVIEDLLYGEAGDPSLPLPDAIVALINAV